MSADILERMLRMTAAEWQLAIHAALRDGNVKAAASLLGGMAVRFPAEAEDLRQMILLAAELAETSSDA